MRYRVESIPKKKSLGQSFATRTGAESYCAALFYLDRIGTKIIDTKKPKQPEPEEATF
jgi:hypothetical protein